MRLHFASVTFLTDIFGEYDSVMNTIIYASVACSQEFFENHFNESGALPGQEVQKYNRLIIEGLAKNQDILVETVTSVPVSWATNINFFYKGKTENKNDITYFFFFTLGAKCVPSATGAFNTSTIIHMFSRFAQSFIPFTNENTTVDISLIHLILIYGR